VTGKVTIVGAGPGDPELLTLKGKRAIEEAEIILYAGSLVNPEVLRYAREGTEIYNTAEMDLEETVEVMEEVQKVHVSDICRKHAIELVRRTREHEALEFGCSPRAQMALVQAARARAFAYARDYVVPEDLFALAEDVICHRTRVSYEALAEGRNALEILNEILAQLD